MEPQSLGVLVKRVRFLRVKVKKKHVYHFRSTGKIVRAHVADFQASSLNGKFAVTIRNTGRVTAAFYVSDTI